MPITGFQAQLKVDDAGTGAAAGSASTAFSGLVTFALPKKSANKFNATELDQQTGGNADPVERELPTGTITVGPTKCEVYFSKANYQRLDTLLGKRGYTFVLVSPDDLSNSPTAVKLTTTFKGFISDLDEVKWDRNGEAKIPFELTVSEKPVLS